MTQILRDLTRAVIEGDLNKATEICQHGIAQGLSPLQMVDEGLKPGIEEVGEKFGEGLLYLPELIKAAEAFTAAMKILNPEIANMGQKINKQGKILMATVKGDLHSIGKNIVAKVLEINGFEVVDLGIDRSPLQICEAIQTYKADALGLSSLMTTTMPYQRDTVNALIEMGLRNSVKVLVGGGPVTQQWADEIGADGYAKDAVSTVNLLQELL